MEEKLKEGNKERGVKRGDVVTIYMPMIPEIAFVMLACTRIGAVHSIVFAGFSVESLKDRIDNGDSKFVFTADEGLRGGRKVKLKETVDQAVAKCGDLVKAVFVFKRTGAEVSFNAGRDVWMHEELPKMRPYCPPEPMDSEDPMFVLYTSGTTNVLLSLSSTSELLSNNSLE